MLLDTLFTLNKLFYISMNYVEQLQRNLKNTNIKFNDIQKLKKTT